MLMEFSTIGAEDGVEEARKRLENVDVLIVWGKEKILGVLCEEHLGRGGFCGSCCELDILVDPTPKQQSDWRPKFVIITEDGEPVSVNHGP